MTRTLFALLLTHWLLSATAQPTQLPIQSHSARLLDRFQLLYPNQTAIHTDVQGYARPDAAAFCLALDTLAGSRSPLEHADLQYLANENNEWIPDTHRLHRPIRKSGKKYFYPTPVNMFEVNTRDFRMRVNPMLYALGGLAANDPSPVFLNQRGLEIRGDVDRKVYFYTNLVETQARYPAYVRDYIRRLKAIPGAGFYKNYQGFPFNAAGSHDFNVATAYIGVPITKHIGMQFGHGAHFIGNGYRSMLLSDFANPAFFLKFSTRVWRFHYQNLFLELSPVSQVDIPDGTILPKKYAAIHYLSYKINPRFTLGFFEATVLHRSRQFEFQYLNPVIFYRTVEGMIGSPDNALLGLNMSWNMLPAMQFYGQLMLDEFRLSEIFSSRGWWANKYGIQAGLKYLNALKIDHLDVQLEYNSARPYTYAHLEMEDSYTHYNQALAHPLGANFREWIGIVRYQPAPRLWLSGRCILISGGDDASGNWGSNPLLSYQSRIWDYGNHIGQGAGYETVLLGLDASWMWQHNCFLDVKWLYRRKDSTHRQLQQTDQVVSLGFRMNIWPNNLSF